jgi:hypothetical protein
MLSQLICYIVKYLKIYLRCIYNFFFLLKVLNRWFTYRALFSWKEDECLLGGGFEPFCVVWLRVEQQYRCSTAHHTIFPAPQGSDRGPTLFMIILNRSDSKSSACLLMTPQSGQRTLPPTRHAETSVTHITSRAAVCKTESVPSPTQNNRNFLHPTLTQTSAWINIIHAFTSLIKESKVSWIYFWWETPPE